MMFHLARPKYQCQSFFFFIYAMETLYRVISSMHIAVHTNSTETIYTLTIYNIQLRHMFPTYVLITRAYN